MNPTLTIRFQGFDLTVEPLNEDPYDWRVLVGGCAILRNIEDLHSLLEGAQR